MVRSARRDLPEWWDWELAFTAHVEARMEERQFSEVELRTMLAAAVEIIPARRAGRFLVRTRHREIPWTVVLEPDWEDRLVFVVTAFPREEP